MKWLEKAKITEILITLSTSEKMYFSELAKKLNMGAYANLNLRLSELKALGLVDEETENKFGGRRYIWLTEKGKKIAEKLIEIEKILEE